MTHENLRSWKIVETVGATLNHSRYFWQVTFHRSQLQVTQYLPQNSIKKVLTVLMHLSSASPRGGGGGGTPG